MQDKISNVLSKWLLSRKKKPDSAEFPETDAPRVPAEPKLLATEDLPDMPLWKFDSRKRAAQSDGPGVVEPKKKQKTGSDTPTSTTTGDSDIPGLSVYDSESE